MSATGNSILFRIGVFVAMASIMLPVLEYMNNNAIFPHVPLWAWFGVTIVGGAIAGLLMGEDFRFAGFIGGLVSGPSALGASIGYTYFLIAINRLVFFEVELVFAAMAGALPGIALYFVLVKTNNATWRD